MVHIIIDDMMYEIASSGRKKAGKAANKVIITTAFGAGVQLGAAIINYSGKAVSIMKNTWNTIHNNLQKRF